VRIDGGNAGARAQRLDSGPGDGSKPRRIGVGKRTRRKRSHIKPYCVTLARRVAATARRPCNRPIPHKRSPDRRIRPRIKFLDRATWTGTASIAHSFGTHIALQRAVAEFACLV